MSAHTKGKLELEDRDERLLLWADGSHDYVAELSTAADGADEDAQSAYEDEQRENARRLVACWNACDGISTEALEAGALLAVLPRAEHSVDEHGPCLCHACAFVRLAKLEGK